MNIQQLIAQVFPYTVGDGAPVYRFNPETHEKYSPQEFLNMVQEIGKTYDMPNAYIQDEQLMFEEFPKFTVDYKVVEGD